MRRREFIGGLGSAAAWPVVARAQQRERMRRIGILTQGAASDPETAAHVTAFVQGLQETGWSVGRNARIEYRWAAGDNALTRKYAAELVALTPDVVLAAGGAAVRPLLDLTSTVPIVFDALDPVAAGFVESLARPGGNATGFTQFEFSLCGKWLELLKQIAPHITRVAVLRDPTNPASIAQFASIQAVASLRAVELFPIDHRNPAAIERGIGAFARGMNNGLILTQSPSSDLNRDLIISLAARHKLPAVYAFRYYVMAGGLTSYGAPCRCVPPRGRLCRFLKGERGAQLS
jgi:putative tryptophan/tyrosine transport system substrate-binding protein